MIVGVAIKIGDYIEIRLPRPNRHCHCFEHFYKVTGVRAPKTKTGGGNQGFYTHMGRYLNRFEAMKHAKRCGQKLVNRGDDVEHKWSHPLFSEDVW